MNKSIQKILSIIPDSIRDPFFILHPDGKIIFSNKPGYSFLNITETPGFVTDNFNTESKENFYKLIDEVIEKNDLLIADRFEIGFTTNEKTNTQTILNTYKHGDTTFIFCTIIPKKYRISLHEINKIHSFDGVQNVIKDNELFEIIKKIKALYPVTFIGREIIQKIVDQLDEIFWVAEPGGKLIITNNYFAKNIGLKNILMEGKNIQDFLPGYLTELNRIINEFIKTTMKCVAVDGVYFQEIESIRQKQIIQLPLFDEEGNINVIIGLSQKIDDSDKSTSKDENVEEIDKFLANFPKPVAFITTTGLLKHYSNDFCKIFGYKPDELHGLKIADVLPISLAESVQRFVLSPDKLRMLPVNIGFEIAKNEEPEYTAYLTKMLYKEDQPDGISILFEKIEYAENLQHLIKSRGRMFEFLIQNNPEPIYIYDKENLQFLEANPAALELYGYSRDEFLQMDLTDLYNPEDIQTLRGSSSEKDSEGKFSEPFRHKRKDGSSVYVEISKISFKFNERDAHFNIVKDVSQRLELVKNNQLFKAAFENSINLIIVTDPDGIITFVNSAVTNTLGLEKSDLENASMASLADDDDRLTINTSIFQSYLTEPVELNIKLKCSDEKLIDAEISATPIVDFETNIESYVIIGKVVTPINEQLKSEKKAEEVIPEKPEKINSSETSQLQTAFLSGVFHEILTPMNVILGFAQELTEGIETLSPDQKEAVEIINQNRGKLLSTMNAIIEFSEIQKNKDEWDITNLTITKVVEEIDNDFYEITGSKDVSFTYGKISSSLQFETDKKKFDCLINNLLRVISRLISEDKVYFSAYQVENDNFLIMISDNFSSVSEGLTDTLKKLFIDKKDPKELGIPTLGVQIIQSLIELLNVEFVSTVDDTGKPEAGFIFPVVFDPNKEQSTKIAEEKDEDVEDIPQSGDENSSIDSQSQTEQSPSTISDEKVESEETPDSEVETKETGFKPKEESIAPEILSSPENKFDAIDFVSGVDDSIPPVNSEDNDLTDESTSVTEDFHEELTSEGESDQEEFASEADFKPLSSQPEEEKSTDDVPNQEDISFGSEEGTEIPDITEVPIHQDVFPNEDTEDNESGTIETSPPESTDEQFEEISLINRQAFTFEEAADGRMNSSDDKLGLKGKTCLYIEDQVDSQILFKVQMKGLKEIKYAVSLEDALPLLETESFDFIVMDINLQGEYNGLDALKIIHKMPKYEDVPIIAVTAYVLPGDKEKFISTGFNDFISKPIFREKMVESLEKIFLQKA